MMSIVFSSLVLDNFDLPSLIGAFAGILRDPNPNHVGSQVDLGLPEDAAGTRTVQLPRGRLTRKSRNLGIPRVISDSGVEI